MGEKNFTRLPSSKASAGPRTRQEQKGGAQQFYARLLLVYCSRVCCSGFLLAERIGDWRDGSEVYAESESFGGVG